jgi:hypothetical protein
LSSKPFEYIPETQDAPLEYETSTSLARRKQRFVDHLEGEPHALKASKKSLEKEYLRTPDLATVRGESILIRALDMVRQKWAQESNNYLVSC